MEIINVTDEIIEINVTEAVVNVVTQNGAYPLPSNVFSVFGRVGNVVGQAGDYTTSIVAEGTNLYYTQARFNTAFGNKTTTDLTEGTNLYYTNARSRAAISENITGLEYSSASGIFSLASGYVIPTQASLDAKVPYTGATGNVTLGEHQLTAGQIAFDQTPTGTAGVGVLRWNDTDGTLDLGLKGGNVTLQIGQEQVKRVVNGAGINLTEAAYQVVKVIGAQGQRLQVALAQANNDLNSATALGIVTENINNNQEGFITTSGEVREINTTGSLQGETWADGDILYLSPSTAGKITNIKPVAPNHMVILGYVEYAHSQHGKIFVKIDNGYEIGELHDVNTTGEATNDGLFLDSDGVWKPKTIAEVLGYTPVTSARTISTTSPLTGGGDLSADRTISMPAATTSVSGYLTSTDWNTFNAKQPLITAGTTAQYYRGDKTFQTLNTLAVPENTNLYYTQARFDTAFSGKTTTDLAEGTNLYFTTARAQAAISGTLPISVSGGVVSISQASGSSNGYLSSTDWNTFNAKQAALNGTGFVKISGTTISYDNSTYLTTISGITAGGELSGTYPNPTLVNSAVTGKILSGVNITGGTIADTDSILTAFGKLQNQINGLIGSSIYEGTWNASTNTPTLASGVGTQGSYYIVSVAGSTNIDGITDWNVGDWIIFDGTAWQQVDNTDAVVSVNGETGAVSLTTSNIAEGTNLYFTNARAIASTLTGYTSGAGTISSSDTILQAIQKLNGNVSGLVTGVSSVFGRTGAVVAASGDYTTTQVTEGTNLYYTEARVSANTDVAANTSARHAAVTLGTANGLSLSTQQLSLGLASGSATGALSSTDWNTFNNKQAALTIGNITSADTSVMTISGGTGAIIGSGVSISLLAATGTNGGIVTTGTQTFAGAKTFSSSVTADSYLVSASDARIRNTDATGRLVLGNSTTSTYGIFYGASHATTPNTIVFASNSAVALTIASNQAATFSNSVQAKNAILTSGGTERYLQFLGYNSSYATIRSNVGFNSSYNNLSLLLNFNSDESGQGNTSLPSWQVNLGGNETNADSFSISRSNAGSFSFNTLFKLSNSASITLTTNSNSVIDFLNLYNNSATSAGGRITFGNGYGYLAAIKVSQRDNGSLADDGQIEFQVASNTSLDTKMRILNNGIVTRPYQPYVIGGMDGNQSISATTFTTLNFSTTTGMFYYENVNNCWDNANRSFTAPVAGVYIVSVSLLCDTIGQVALFVNGLRKHSIPFWGVNNTTTTFGGTATIPLNAGDVLTLQGYATNSGSVTQNQYHTWFSIYLL